jgi:hypothetical protein
MLLFPKKNLEGIIYMITKQEIMEALGRDKTTITDELVTTMNMIIADEPEVGNFIKDNFLTYTQVLKSGKYSLKQYLNAITFASYKLMNMTNQQAYIHTYPGRYERLKKRYMDVEGLTKKEFDKKVSSYVCSVAAGPLVTTILSQVQIPTKLLNMHVLQEAINVETELMRGARSETVREKAANTLITYLGQEEENKIQLDAGFRKDEVIDQYEMAMKRMVEEQLHEIQKGADVKKIANISIMEAEVLD